MTSPAWKAFIFIPNPHQEDIGIGILDVVLREAAGWQGSPAWQATTVRLSKRQPSASQRRWPRQRLRYCELSRSLGSVRLWPAYWVSSSGCVVSEDGLRIACPPPIGSMSLRRISDGTIASGGRVYARPSVG